MIGATFCSGIGAPEVAAPDIDWRFASEIAPFPRAVLAQRFGYVVPEDHCQGDPLLWGDMATVTPDNFRRHGVPLPDIIVAGTPCQSFSFAGLRKGLSDPRGNLTLKFVEVCHAIVDARPDGRLAVLWENVPGVLSDKENAFGAFLGGLVGAGDALPPPDGTRWPSVGMVQGPRARAAWRVFDAQYIGVPQRRRRVFLVVDFGERCDPASVLFERQGVPGHTAPGEKAGATVAALTANGVGTCGPDDNQAQAGHLIPFDCKGTEVQTGDGITPPLRAMAGSDGEANGGGQLAVAIQERAAAENLRQGPGGAGFRADDVAYTLEARQVPQAVAFDPNQVTSPHNRSTLTPGICHTLPATATPTALCAPQVRRLTPLECHRLQGFADDHCAVTYRGKPAADGPQYKALGNSMAVPCVAWVIRRMQASMEAHK